MYSRNLTSLSLMISKIFLSLKSSRFLCNSKGYVFVSLLVNECYVCLLPVLRNFVLQCQIVDGTEWLENLVLEFLQQPGFDDLFCLEFVQVLLHVPFVNCANFQGHDPHRSDRTFEYGLGVHDREYRHVSQVLFIISTIFPLSWVNTSPSSFKERILLFAFLDFKYVKTFFFQICAQFVFNIRVYVVESEFCKL